MQDSVRDKAGYRGKLFEDVFADPRLNLQPPGAAAMALSFCRNHNWIAEKLLIESKDDFRFATIPEKGDEKELIRLDEHLFQTARNINIGTIITAVLYDYVRMLLGINRENTTWTLPIAADLSDVGKDILPSSQDIPKATGNQCSIEFNFIYRWHSAISVEDEAWVTQAFQRLGQKYLGARLGENIPFRVPDRVAWTQQSHHDRATKDPRSRDYFQLAKEKVERDPVTKRYPNAVLANYLKRSTEYAAGAFGGRQVPESLKEVEVMGILHGRQLGVCTLNELRKLCNLREYTTFKEMNSDPAMAQALEDLYGDVSNVELYPGLVAEEAKPKQTATGLCAGRTITYAILSDAVALVRGDRFLTTELNPYNLTQWGYDEIQHGPDTVFGNVLGNKLLNRHLGDELMPKDSIYTHFMFSTPEETKTNIRKFGMEQLFRETRT
jgi:linoleate 10R-lipoxygenase